MKKKILRMLSEKGILADTDAVDSLSKLPDPLNCVRTILHDENRPLVLTKADVENYLACPARPIAPRSISIEHVSERGLKSMDTSIPDDGVKVLKDITGDSTCVGNVIDFAKLFNDRFRAIRRILARRRELVGFVSIGKAKKVQRDVRFIGIVNDVRTTKNGHTAIDLEDEEDKVHVLIMKGSKSADTMITDEVVGVVGSFSKDREMVVAKEIIRPDVPVNSSMTPNGSSSVVAFVSDIHVGSSMFLQEEWGRFIDWLDKDPEASKIMYIIMPGDLVDGIGIYPSQEDELLIEDIYAQYTELARLVSMIPERIKIVMMPGNHDAVRLAEPQPALPSSIASMFDSRTKFVGNPCLMEIEGRTILAYHGRSMDDFIGSIRDLSYKDPSEIMKEMLRRRHMAPIYGKHTAIAPEQKDYLVIDRVPNIFVTGHVHACSVSEYRGIKLINASAWQSQTAFQRMHNQVPDPAKVPMVDLGTGDVWVKDFST